MMIVSEYHQKVSYYNWPNKTNFCIQFQLVAQAILFQVALFLHIKSMPSLSLMTISVFPWLGWFSQLSWDERSPEASQSYKICSWNCEVCKYSRDLYAFFKMFVLLIKFYAPCGLQNVHWSTLFYTHIEKKIYSFLAYGSEWQDGSFRCGNTQMCFQIAILCWFSWVQLKQHYEACVCYSWTEQSVQDFFPSCSGDWIIFMSASLSQSFMDIYHQSKLIKHYSIVEFMQNF